MERTPFPEAARRGLAVRAACEALLRLNVRLLPPDPEKLAAEMGFVLWSRSGLAERNPEQAEALRQAMKGRDAFSFSAKAGAGEKERTVYFIVYDDEVRSSERIRFSITHEFGHILLKHHSFENVDLNRLESLQFRILEDEANIFARNFLCPPPVADLIRGNLRDPKWAALLCLSEAAWQVRINTLDEDRRQIDQALADRIRIQFREYMFGRRCRECGSVFTDEFRGGKCRECGSPYLVWNPEMETREEALAHRHAAGAAAEDLAPRVGENKVPDLTEYWKLIRKEKARPGRKAGG